MKFEDKISKLAEQRKNLNNSNNFQEISVIWNEIKNIYEDCTKEIKTISENLEKLNTDSTEEKIGLSFEESFKEIKAISEQIKTCSISELPEYIKKLKNLKQNCLTILKKEKCKIQEIK